MSVFSRKLCYFLSMLFSGGVNAYSSFADPFYFIPSLAVQDAATSAAIESVTGKNIYEAYAKGIINDPRGKVSVHLCNGKDETLKEALIGGCSLVEDVSVSILDTEYYIKRGNQLIKIDIKKSKDFITETTTQRVITKENPLIQKHQCKNGLMHDVPTSCFVYKMAPFIFSNLSHKQKIIKALENPCASLTPLEKARKMSGYPNPRIPFLAEYAESSRHILDCNKNAPETFSTIVDTDTQSVLVIRNKK
ncbi:hypothetical protein [Serratia sp. 121840015-1]|uniref:Uncharacterized protein n=2 Tax=Serratia marcescens TaxID=615 RepID=A0A1C3HNJ7_SERMA|nr:Uncharacterised protein [Serratia marcescens]